MKVYLVMGDTGEWDSYIEWVASVCTSKKVANTRARKLNAIGGRFKPKVYDRVRLAAIQEALLKAGDLSPSVDNNGTKYDVTGPFEVQTRG